MLNRPKPLWLAGCDLRGVYLNDANLSQADLRGANFSGQNLLYRNNGDGTFLRLATTGGARLSASLGRAVADDGYPANNTLETTLQATIFSEVAFDSGLVEEEPGTGRRMSSISIRETVHL